MPILLRLVMDTSVVLGEAIKLYVLIIWILKMSDSQTSFEEAIIIRNKVFKIERSQLI